jgi:hypothetical protein
MKKLTFMAIAGILFSLLISNSILAEEAGITVGKGTLKIGGILQAGFAYNLEDEAGIDAFTLNRARFLFFGAIVPEKVKYFVQTETVGSPSILDYKAQFFYIPKTEIAVGRFLPNLTLYMPYHTGKLEMINYPLFVIYRDPTTKKFLYSPWRQVGIQTTTQTDYVDFNVGIFNGADEPNNTTDNNDVKDFLLRADFKPPLDKAQIRVGGYAWIGSALPAFSKSWTEKIVVNVDTIAETADTIFQSRTFSTSFPEETLERNRFGGFATLDYKATEDITLKFRGEFLMASTENLFYAHIDSVASTDAQAFFAHVAVQPSPRVEFLARYDFHDPNTDMSYEEAKYETGSGKGAFANGICNDDEEAWLTAGVNYYLEGINAMFYLNYIHKMEPGYKNVCDEETCEWVKEKREVDNDVVQAQVQITF